MEPQATPLRDYLSLRYIAGGHPLTQLFSQRLGAIIAWLGQTCGMTPNQMTAFAGLLITGGAWVYATAPANVGGLVLSLVLLQLAYGADCADGQLARATGQTSARGAWWDVFVDFYAINVLSFSVLWHLLATPLEPAISVGGVMIFTIARNLSLYSSTMARSGGGEGAKSSSLSRQVFRIMIDTSFLLLCVAVLRNQAELLVAYLYGISGLLLAHSVYVGLRDTQAQ